MKHDLPPLNWHSCQTCSTCFTTLRGLEKDLFCTYKDNTTWDVDTQGEYFKILYNKLKQNIHIIKIKCQLLYTCSFACPSLIFRAFRRRWQRRYSWKFECWSFRNLYFPLFVPLSTVAFPYYCTKSLHNSKHVPCGKFRLTRWTI